MSATLDSFHPPLIRHAAGRSLASRGLSIIATALLWTAWAYLLAAALGGAWSPQVLFHLLPVDPEMNRAALLRPLFLCIAAAASACLFLLLRLRSDRRRFAGHDRRRMAALPSDDEVRDMLGAPYAPLPEIRAARRLVVHHDAGGVIMQVETDQHPPAKDAVAGH